MRSTLAQTTASLATIIATVGATACAQATSEHAAAQGAPVAMDATAAHACDDAFIQARLDALFNAIGNGASGIAKQFFAYGQEAPFQWFSFTQLHTGTKEDFTTYSRDSLDARFSQHHTEGDRFVLNDVIFNGERQGAMHFGPVNFLFYDGSNPAVPQRAYPGTGKGAFHCPSRSFIVLSLVTQRPQ